MADADAHKGPGPPSVRAQPQRGLEIADRRLGLPRPQLDPAADHPAASKAWVERQSTVDQFDRGVDVLAKVAEHVGSVAEHTGVVAGETKRLPGEIDTRL